MPQQPSFDVEAAHRYFAADCFNKAWDLIDKADRTAEEGEQMLRLSLASHWHWTQRPDYDAGKASIGYWQTSRVCALLGQAANARRYGQLCLEASGGTGTELFHEAYAYEALARAAGLAGDAAERDEYLAKARGVARRMTDAETSQALLDDLATIL
jgi:hypothetical protein